MIVIDEFDKAPTEVVCVLKGLIEDGEVKGHPRFLIIATASGLSIRDRTKEIVCRFRYFSTTAAGL